MNNKQILITLIAFLIILSMATIKVKANSSNNSNTIYVGGIGLQNYTYIQDAINQSKNGDKIFVYPRIYNENLNIHKSIELIGKNKKNTTIISNKTGEDVIYISANNCTIRNLTIINNAELSSTAINIISNENIIKNNIIKSSSKIGIYLYRTELNQILNNSFRKNAITIVGNQSNWISHEIKNNTINGYKLSYHKSLKNYSIELQNNPLIITNCSNIKIKNCNISNVDNGIIISYSNKTNIYNCNISNCYHGIHLYNVKNSLISYNFIDKNEYGLYITHSDENQISENLFTNNSKYGVWICCLSKNNILFLNNFSKNFINAGDLFPNQWYKDEKGNYWSDYTGVDENNDGIGDIPYDISDGENKDLYPLINDSDQTKSKNNKTIGFEIFILIFAIIFLYLIKAKKF